MTRYSPNHPAVKAWIDNTPPHQRTIEQRTLAVRARLADRPRRRTGFGHKTTQAVAFTFAVLLLPVIAWFGEHDAPMTVTVPCALSILWTAFTFAVMPDTNDDLS